MLKLFSSQHSINISSSLWFKMRRLKITRNVMTHRIFEEAIEKAKVFYFEKSQKKNRKQVFPLKYDDLICGKITQM